MVPNIVIRISKYPWYFKSRIINMNFGRSMFIIIPTIPWVCVLKRECYFTAKEKRQIYFEALCFNVSTCPQFSCKVFISVRVGKKWPGYPNAARTGYFYLVIASKEVSVQHPLPFFWQDSVPRNQASVLLWFYSYSLPSRHWDFSSCGFAKSRSNHLNHLNIKFIICNQKDTCCKKQTCHPRVSPVMAWVDLVHTTFLQ